MSLSTFCVGFTDPRFDESARARRVAAHLGTSHHELVLTPQEALKVVDELPDIYDQPFGDPSQIPTLLVSRFARKQVKVALSGDGGDELFGGYQRYQHAPRNWSLLQRAPLVLRRVAASITAAVPDPVWRGLGHIGGGTGRAGLPASLLRFSQRAKAADFIGYYDAQIDAPWGTALGRSPPPDIVTDGNDPRRPALDAMRLRDLGSYLPGDVLVKIDRASMSAGLEVRAPLLDSTLLDLAWRLPFAQLIDDGRGKLILRRLLLRHLPAELFDRPKQGFGVPIAEWLRGPLKQWAQDLLESGTLEATGLVDMKAARRLWDRHQSGIVNAEFALWNLLMLSGWLARRAARRS